ncbi:caspase family protein [Flammeovirga sp. SJP92]|uniref:caspase family protein n=1 Tax=Flammeovirga sp. SJP92 TaxID=1775430 RepID=UPI000ABEA12A|nr:caspase family protein [Flammeovirga sp. SJP92]
MKIRIVNSRQILLFFVLFFSTIGGYAQSQFPPSFDLDGDERFPSITSDGKVLLFARENKAGFTFLLSNKLDGKFMPPTTLELPKNLPYPTGPMISYDGRWIYFSAKGKNSGSDIYRMKRWGRRLGKPQKIEGKVNTSGYEMYPSLTKDGKGLYFSRLEDFSDPIDLKYALYYSELDKDGKWGEPVKLPEGVNLYSEKEPRILPDGKTLMFTSKISDESFDYDVMMTRKNDDGTWSDPEPVLSINQSKLNHPPCIDGVSQKAYFSRDGKLMEIPLNKVIETKGEVKKEVALSRNTDNSQNSDKAKKEEASPAKKPSSVSSFSDLGFDIKDYVPEPKYKAIIIGINTYNDGKIASLDNPEKDAASLEEILTTYYAFNKEDVKLLLSPTRESLIETFDAMMEESSENDHILIFYAGHGHWDQRRKAGYWLPSDAKAKSTANWVRNSTIKEYVASFKAKHVLLISDACFSGSIFKTRAAFDGADKSIKALESLPSRKAMTSGTLKEVPDESVFVKYLQKRLISNQEKFISARSLFDSFRVAVMNNSENVPQFGVINQTGDEGGGFIFIKK